VGRITPSFRRLFLDVVERLVRKFRPALRDLGHQRAFDELLTIWAGEAGALSMSGLPIPLEAMSLLANVHNLAAVVKLEVGVKRLQNQVFHVKEGEFSE
jgi:hypothetical protein